MKVDAVKNTKFVIFCNAASSKTIICIMCFAKSDDYKLSCFKHKVKWWVYLYLSFDRAMSDKSLNNTRDELMKAGYIFDDRRSHCNLRSTEGLDYWVDCISDGRDIRFEWKTAIYPGDPYRNEVETLVVLNKDGMRPMSDDSDEIFELNRMQDYETLDTLGYETTNTALAVSIARRVAIALKHL